MSLNINPVLSVPVHLGDNRIPFAEIQTEFDAWCLKSGFTDAVHYLSVFLEECRLVVGLHSLGSNTTGAEFDRVRLEERESFHWFGTPKQIKFLREHYGVSSQLEEHILSLIGVRIGLCTATGLSVMKTSMIQVE